VFAAILDAGHGGPVPDRDGVGEVQDFMPPPPTREAARRHRMIRRAALGVQGRQSSLPACQGGQRPRSGPRAILSRLRSVAAARSCAVGQGAGLRTCQRWTAGSWCCSMSHVSTASGGKPGVRRPPRLRPALETKKARLPEPIC
jgi:hypothetical protein